MAEQKEGSGSDWAARLEKIITGGLLLLTILYGRWIYQVFGRDVWDLTQNNKMGEAGDFLAGFTTPVVFLWLIYGYFLQRRELGLQRKELHETQKALGKQAEVMERQADAERRRSTPHLQLELDSFTNTYSLGQDDIRGVFILRNIGAAATQVAIALWENRPEQNMSEERLELLERNGSHGILVQPTPPVPPGDSLLCYFRVRFTSELQEQLEQRWTIILHGADRPIEIYPANKEEPIPLKDGESPPPVKSE